MSFNKEEFKKSSVLFIVTNVLPKEEVVIYNNKLKDYQKHGFRLTTEFGEHIKNYRIHFYHFEQKTISDFTLLDKVLSRLANSVRELVLDEKIFIVIDKEQYDWMLDSSGDKFENKITACLPADNCPLKLDMAITKEQIEVQQLHFFIPDGIDKQGGFVRTFSKINFEDEASKN